MSTGEHRRARDGFRHCTDVLPANPTTLVVGAAGTGTSTVVRCLVCRSLCARRRGVGLDWVAILAMLITAGRRSRKASQRLVSA